MQIEVLSGAEQDIQEMFNLLFEFSEKRANRFLAEVDRVLEIVAAHPAAGRSWSGSPVRRMNLHSFPLCLFYEVHGRRIMVGAVLDMRCEPADLLRQLRRRHLL